VSVCALPGPFACVVIADALRSCSLGRFHGFHLSTARTRRRANLVTARGRFVREQPILTGPPMITARTKQTLISPCPPAPAAPPGRGGRPADHPAAAAPAPDPAAGSAAATSRAAAG